MNASRNKNITLLLVVFLVQIAGCASLSINPPTAEKPSLLILPVELVRDSQLFGYGFDFAYEIVSYDDSISPYMAFFRLPVKNDMVIVDSLPPGKYIVSKLLTMPVGAGNRIYDKRGSPVDFRFRLESGTITILPYSLRVHIIDEPYEQDKTRPYITKYKTTYSSGIQRTTVQQRSDILARIKVSPNFSAWKVHGEKETVATSPKIGAQYQENVVAENLRGDWSGKWRSISEGDAESCTDGSLSFNIDGARLRGEGADSAGNRYRISASFISNGVIRGKLSLNRTLLAKVSGKIYDDGTILGSFDYGNDCMAEWKANKNP